MPLSDPNLRGLAGNYAAQSAMATLAMMAILLLEDVVLRVAIVEAMASTVFTMFVVPNSVVQPSGGDQRTRDWGSGRLSRRGRHWAPFHGADGGRLPFAVRLPGNSHGGPEYHADGGDACQVPAHCWGRSWSGRARVGPVVSRRYLDRCLRAVDHTNGAAI